MNKLNGHIKKVRSTDQMSLVSIQVGPYQMSAVILQTPVTVDYLKNKSAVQVLFKETEVIIGIGEIHQISLSNRLPGIITDLHKGSLLSKIILKTEVGEIKAVIGSEAVEELALETGKKAIAMIKTNEIILAR